MKKLIFLIIVQIPFFVLGQQKDDFRHCSETWSQFQPYDVCTYDDTLGSVFLSSDEFNSIYKVYYDLHFSSLDTNIFNRPDSGQLIRFWYIDENGDNSRMDMTNYELYNAKEIFEKLNDQIWEIVSNWKFYVTPYYSYTYLSVFPEQKDVWIDFNIPISSKRP